MGVIYQLTFFLALGLLAIVITIFVFAVSLLGRAIEAAAISEADKLAERKASNVEEMAAIRQEIQDAEASGQIPKGLRRKLEKLEKKDKKFEKEQSKIRKAPESLAVRGGVYYPCAFLIAALALNGGALYLSNIQNIHWAISLSLWILGLAAVGYSIYRICKSLGVIESVAVPSEEVAFKRETEAFKAALKEIEEEKKPKLGLTFEDAQSPFHVGTESEMGIEFAVHLIKGDIARSAVVYFGAPAGFDFLGMPRGPRLVGKYANYVSGQFELGDIVQPLSKLRWLKFRAPSKPERYTAFYRLLCEGFHSGTHEFEIEVEAIEVEDIPF